MPIEKDYLSELIKKSCPYRDECESTGSRNDCVCVKKIDFYYEVKREKIKSIMAA